MKTNLLLKRLFFLWVFAFSVSVWGQATYTLVTQTSDLVAGGKYLVASTKTNGPVILLGPQNTNNRTAVSGNTIASGKITTTAATATAETKPYEITFGGTGGAWTLNDAVYGTILGPSKGANTNNYLKANTTGTPTYTITIDASGSAVMTCFGSEANTDTTPRNIIRLNGTTLFASYASGQNPVYLFKKAETTPKITFTGTFNSFSYVENNGPSIAQSFTVNGSNLTNNITVTAPANFEVSTTSETGFGSEVTLTQTGGNVASTPVHVRLKSGLSIANYTGDLTLTSAGASNVMVTLSGVVTPPIAATSNNNSFGTVSLSGNVITATPLAGYTYASPAYTVIPNGSATVTQNGNEFTVTPNASTTVQINFAAKPNFTLSLRKDGSAYTNVNFPFTTYEGNTIVLPTLTDGCGDFTFVGWDTNSGTVSAPTYAGGATYTTTASNVTLYAVYSQTAEGGTTTSTYGFEDADTGWTSTMTKSNLDKKTGTYSGLINKDGVYATFNSKVVSPLSLSFSLKKTSTNNNYEIYVQTSPDNSTWTTRETFLMSSFTNGSWVEKTADLSTYSNVYVRLDYYGTTAVRYLDDISLVYEGGLVTTYTTAPNCPITWNGTEWSNTDGPDAATPAIIAGPYSIADSFVAKSLTVNATLTVNSSVTTGNVTNNAEIIVNDNASFIQNTDATYRGDGTFTVNRNGVSEAGKYAFWSSPVIGQNMYGIFATAPTYVMTYNTATNYYDVLPTPAIAAKGAGYSIKTPSSPATIFAGTPNNGEITTDLTLASFNYNLVGNPYPSNLDLTKFCAANTGNINSTLWFWDNTSGPVQTQTGQTTASNGFATFNAGGSGTWVEAQNGTRTTDGNYAKIGQGFIVKAITGTLTFNNDMRVAGTGNDFNKSAASNSGEGKLWLTLSTSYNSKVTQAITYQNGASNEFDAYDSKAMSLRSDAFYSLVGAEKLIIQGKSPFTTDDVVLLGNKHFEAGNFKIELTKTEGIFADGQSVYLKDKLTGSAVNLQNGPYSFSSNSGEFADRFEVMYKQPILGTGAAVNSSLVVYRSGDDFVIDSPSKIESVEVYDVSGRLMQTLKTKSNKEIVSDLSTGVFIFKIKTATGLVSKKVIK